MGANATTFVPAYVAGEVLTAADLTVTNSGVPVFATTTTRDAAFGGTGEKTLAQGQVCFIEAAPNRLQVYDGTSWVDFDATTTAYTPTLTNVTLGNGTINGRYQRIGHYVAAGVYLGFGSTTSVSGLIGISLPFAAVAGGGTTRSWFLAGFGDTGTATYSGLGTITESATRVDFYVPNVSGTYPFLAATSATVPHTWANTDEIYGTFIYRIA